MARRHLHLTSAVLLIGVLFSFLFPSVGAWLNSYAVWLLMAIMVVSLLGVKLSHLLHVPRRELLFAFVAHYAFIPLLTWLLLLLFVRSPDFALGILLAVVMPIGVTAPALVKLMRGNFEDTLALTVIFFLSSIVISPLLLWLLAGVYVPIKPIILLKPMALFILIPLVLAVVLDFVLERFARNVYGRLHQASGKISLALLFLIIWGVSGQGLAIQEMASVFGLFIFVFVLFLVVFISIMFFSHWTTKTCPDEIALTMLMYKSYVLALVIALQVFSRDVAFAIVIFAVGQNVATAVWMKIVEKTGCSLFAPKHLKTKHFFSKLCHRE